MVQFLGTTEDNAVYIGPKDRLFIYTALSGQIFRKQVVKLAFEPKTAPLSKRSLSARKCEGFPHVC